jgi:NADPH:quinone reductase-like Zn-dependent oxidoreductase
VANDEVLERVHAASVNSWDRDLVSGKPYYARLGGFLKPQHPILGADIAGRVEAVGRDVTLFQPGDEVYGDLSGCGWGGFAEYVAAREDALGPKPESLTYEQAAAAPQAAVLALQGLRDKGQLEAGQSVLINGAGGGVGTYGVQLAKSFDAEVTGVDSAPKLDRLLSLGADQVIDFTQQDFTRLGTQHDLILDVVGRRSIFDHAHALHPGGRYVMIGGSTGRLLQTLTAGSVISVAGRKNMGILAHKPNRDDLAYLTELFDAGTLVSVIDRTFPLAEVPDALRYFGTGQVKGKVVITV